MTEEANTPEAEPTPTQIYGKEKSNFEKLVHPILYPVDKPESGAAEITPWPSEEKSRMISEVVETLSPPDGMQILVNDLQKGMSPGQSFIRFCVTDALQGDRILWGINWNGVPYGGLIDLNFPDEWTERADEFITAVIAEVLEFMGKTIVQLESMKLAKETAEETKH